MFRYDKQLFLKIGSALELGRSFVRPDYQRQYAPLLLLWKGIARFVAERPETPVLFGAVSISKEYSSLSREMIVRYFEQRKDGVEFADLTRHARPSAPPSFAAGIAAPSAVLCEIWTSSPSQSRTWKKMARVCQSCSSNMRRLEVGWWDSTRSQVL